MTSCKQRAGRRPTGDLLLVATCLLVFAGCPEGKRERVVAQDATVSTLRSDPPLVKTLDVRLHRSPGGARPNDCSEWPSCDPLTPNAQLFIRYDEDQRRGPGLRQLDTKLTLDLAGDAPVIIERKADGTYVGDFCLDARALCAAHRQVARPAGAPNRLPERVIFRGREVVGREEARPVDFDGLWRGDRVALMSTGPLAVDIDPLETLFITKDSVIKDTDRTWTPCWLDTNNVYQPLGTKLGKWTFGRLMQGLAGSEDATKDFLREWLLQLQGGGTVNGFPVPPRPKLRSGFLDPWCKASTSNDCTLLPDDKLELDPAIAPFRLLAIVNRIDLADVFTYGSTQPSDAGEVRFVFSAEKWDDCKADVRFFVIIEYQVKKTTCDDLTKWAKEWLDLGKAATTDYNKKLEEIVETVVAAPVGRVRVRTSEVAFAPDTRPGDPVDSESWAMRQFELDHNTGKMVAKPLNRTPDGSFQEAPDLADLKKWIETSPHEYDINWDRHEIPDRLEAKPLAAGVGKMRPERTNNPGTFWKLPGVGNTSYPETRHHFSLNTCTACHAGETVTEATHVTPGGFNDPVKRSKFLDGGLVVTDPRGDKNPNNSNKVYEHEYAELKRREQVLACIGQPDWFGAPCLCDTTLQKLSMSH